MYSYIKTIKGTCLLVSICILVLICAFVFFLYFDFINTVDNANVLLNAIKHGKIMDFYDLTVKQSQTNFAANYNFPIYVLFAIWQLPVFFVTKKLGMNYLETPICMLWSKILLLLFAVLSAYYIYKIVYLCCKKKKNGRLAVFLYLSSGYVFYSIFVCGQLETISTALMLGGLYYYIQKKYKWFYLFFLISVPFKFFSLFLALPLLAYKEKRILKLLFSWMALGFPILLEKIVFNHSPIYRYALYSQNRDVTEKLMNTHLSIGRPVSVFILLYIALVVFLYMEHNIENRTVIYSSFFVWGVFIAFGGINTYWVYLLAPFAILAICINNQYMRISVLLETISSYIVSIACMGTPVFQDEGILSRLFYSSVFSIPKGDVLKYHTIDMFFKIQGWKSYYTLFSTVFVAGVVLLLILTLPKLQKGLVENRTNDILWLRPLLLVVVSSVIIYASTSQTNKIAFDTRDFEATVAQCDLIEPLSDNNICQEVIFSDSRNLDSIVLKFRNTDYQRANMALLHIELQDDKGLSVFDDYIGCCTIRNNEEISINMKGTAVEKGKTYIIKLSGCEGNKYYWNQESLYPYISTAINQPCLKNIVINDEQIENEYLWFEIR